MQKWLLTLAYLPLRGRGFTSRTLQVPTGTMHVLEAKGQGELPPIVLLHGLSANATNWRTLVPLLLPHTQRIILPELPAHGRSHLGVGPMNSSVLHSALASGLEQVLDEPCVLVGNSMGGYLAIRYAAQHPHRVRSLVLSSPGGAPLPEAVRTEVLGRFRVSTHTQALALIDRVMHRVDWRRHLMAWVTARRLRAPWIQELLLSVTDDDELRAHEVAGLSMPTLFLWGQSERVLHPDQLRFYLEHLPGHAQVVHPERYGHAPYLECCQDFAERVLQHSRLAARSAQDSPP